MCLAGCLAEALAGKYIYIYIFWQRLLAAVALSEQVRIRFVVGHGGSNNEQRRRIELHYGSLSKASPRAAAL